MARKRDPFKVGQYAYLANGSPSQYFRAWREHRGMTQQQVARILGTNASAISKYELGELSYTQRLVEALATAYKAKVGDLLNGPPSEASSPVANLLDLPPDKQKAILESLQTLLLTVKPE